MRHSFIADKSWGVWLELHTINNSLYAEVSYCSILWQQQHTAQPFFVLPTTPSLRLRWV